MRLFVGNLSWKIDAETLKSFFESVGEVSDARIIKERSSGRSRGFGFVTFVSEEMARTAIEQLNGTELQGREIRIDEALQRSST